MHPQTAGISHTAGTPTWRPLLERLPSRSSGVPSSSAKAGLAENISPCRQGEGTETGVS